MVDKSDVWLTDQLTNHGWLTILFWVDKCWQILVRPKFDPFFDKFILQVWIVYSKFRDVWSTSSCASCPIGTSWRWLPGKSWSPGNSFKSSCTVGKNIATSAKIKLPARNFAGAVSITVITTFVWTARWQQPEGPETAFLWFGHVLAAVGDTGLFRKHFKKPSCC